MTKKEYNRLIFIHNGVFFSNKLNRILTKEEIQYESIYCNEIISNIKNYQNDLILIPELLFEIISINVDHSSQSHILDVVVLIKKTGQRKLNSDKLNIVDIINLNSSDDKILEIINKHMTNSE